MSNDFSDDILDVSLNSYGASRTRPEIIKSLRLDTIATGRDDYNVAEPSSNSFSVYPYNKATTTLSGHVIELDDTPGAKRIMEMHTSGTFYEIQPDGTKVTKIFGDDFYIALVDHTLFVGGNLVISCQQDAMILVKGDVHQKVGGNLNTVVHGDMNTHVKGDINTYAEGTIRVEAEKDLYTKSRKETKIFAKDVLWLKGEQIQGNSSNFTTPKTVDIGAGLNVSDSICSPPIADIQILKTQNDVLSQVKSDETQPKDRTKA